MGEIRLQGKASHSRARICLSEGIREGSCGHHFLISSADGPIEALNGGTQLWPITLDLIFHGWTEKPEKNSNALKLLALNWGFQTHHWLWPEERGGRKEKICFFFSRAGKEVGCESCHDIYNMLKYLLIAQTILLF